MFLFSDSYYFQETIQLLQTGTPLLAWSISKFLSPKKPFKNYHLLICCSFFSSRAMLIEFHLTGCLQIVSTTLTWDNELSYQKWWWRLSHNREALMKRSTGKRPARPTSTGRKGHPPPPPRGASRNPLTGWLRSFGDHCVVRSAPAPISLWSENSWKIQV